MNSGYWQIELDPADKHKTAFVTRQGLYEFNVMPFGMQWHVCLIYLDDIIVYGSTFDTKIKNLATVFDKLLEADLKLKARKCTLFARQVKYLGHVISDNGV